MPRTARVKSKTGIYHVVLRGINRQTVFFDDEDKEVFLNRVKLAKDKFHFTLYAFCFMGNHVHLVIQETPFPIGKIMQFLLASYIFWYNRKYERIGNLFQDRYKSEPIDDEVYLLSAVRYVHQNPVKAQLVATASDYQWSSYAAYLSDKPSIIDSDLVWGLLDGDYERFLMELETLNFIEPTEKHRISDEKLISEAQRVLKTNNLSKLHNLTREELSKALNSLLEIDGTTPYQISRVTGITMGIIRSHLASRQF